MTAAGETEAERGPVVNTHYAETRAPVSLSRALNGTRNSLGLVRLILAVLVIVDHAFILGGFGHNPLHAATRGQASIGSLAVAGFFAISGYLIAKSGMTGDVIQFLWRRALRIFPAFWVVLLVTALVGGPLVWITSGKALGEYFAIDGNGPLNYILSNWALSIGSHGIDDLLLATPYGKISGMSEFNGSLWTLILEWSCYMMIAAFVALGVMRNVRVLVPTLGAVFLAIQLGIVDGLSAIPAIANPAFPAVALAFLMGATMAVYGDQVPFHNGLGVLAVLILVGTLRFGGFDWLGIVAGVYFVLYLGARLPKQLHWIGARNDYSYGIYIYGFLVQQVLAHFGVHQLGYIPYVLIALVIASAFAWLSWHGIEKRAMSLKAWGPGRGWRHMYARVVRRTS